MKNKTLKTIAKNMLKELLAKCNDSQQLLFKRMYCHNNLDISMNDAVEQMEDSKIDHAFTQVERTLEKVNNSDEKI